MNRDPSFYRRSDNVQPAGRALLVMEPGWMGTVIDSCTQETRRSYSHCIAVPFHHHPPVPHCAISLVYSKVLIDRN